MLIKSTEDGAPIWSRTVTIHVKINNEEKLEKHVKRKILFFSADFEPTFFAPM